MSKRKKTPTPFLNALTYSFQSSKPSKKKARKRPVSIFFNLAFSKIVIRLMGVSIILFFTAFLVIPLFNIIKSAFIADGTFTLTYLKLLFKEKTFWTCLSNSLKIALTTTTFATALAFPLALINNRFKYTGKNLLTSLLIISMFAPPFVGTIGVKRFFAQYGTINLLLMNTGLITAPIHFLNSGSILPVVFIQVLHLYPLMYLNLSTTLLNIDPSIEEVGITLGISRWRRYKDIIWPLARPGFFSAAILIFIGSFTDLGTPLVTNFNNVLSVSIFREVLEVNKNPYAYAMVFCMMLITVAATLSARFIFVVDNRHRMISKNYVKRTLYKPTTWEKIGIYTFFIFVITISLMPHLGVMLTSLEKRWFNTYLPDQYTLSAYQSIFSNIRGLGIGNSLFYALGGTLVSVVFSTFMAFVIARKRHRFYILIDILVMIPLLLPGLILAFGYLITYMYTPLDPTKNPTILIVILYSIRYMPYLVRSVMGALQQMNPNLEETAMVFGASLLQTFFKITVPIIMPSIIAGSLLCFVRAMLEVTSSLMLCSLERYYPITKVIYTFAESQGDGLAKASALGMVTILLISIISFVASRLIRKKGSNIFKVT